MGNKTEERRNKRRRRKIVCRVRAASVTWSSGRQQARGARQQASFLLPAAFRSPATVLLRVGGRRFTSLNSGPIRRRGGVWMWSLRVVGNIGTGTPCGFSIQFTIYKNKCTLMAGGRRQACQCESQRDGAPGTAPGLRPRLKHAVPRRPWPRAGGCGGDGRRRCSSRQ